MTPKIARDAPGARVFRRLAAGEGGAAFPLPCTFGTGVEAASGRVTWSVTFPEKQARDFYCSARGWSQAMASVMGMKKRAKVFGSVSV